MGQRIGKQLPNQRIRIELGSAFPHIHPMRTVEDIIALLGGPEAAAQRCSIGTEAVRKWRQARAIPPRHWPAILASTGLSLAELPGAPETRAETTMPQPETAPDAVP